MRFPHTNTAPAIMTKEHPRVDEFLDAMAGAYGLDLVSRCDLDSAHFGKCDGKTGRPLAKRVLSRMGFSGAQVRQSLLYFDSSRLACDCAVYLEILNVEGGYESQLQEYRRVLDTVAAGAF